MRWHISQILEMLPQWRHNGYFDVLRWGTLTPSIFVQFSSNSHMLLFNSWLCMGLQSSVFGSYLLSEMTVVKTVKNRDVKKVTENFKQTMYSYRFWTAEHEYVHGLMIRSTFSLLLTVENLKTHCTNQWRDFFGTTYSSKKYDVTNAFYTTFAWN